MKYTPVADNNQRECDCGGAGYRRDGAARLRDMGKVYSQSFSCRLGDAAFRVRFRVESPLHGVAMVSSYRDVQRLDVRW